jgi:two-component system, cell cycle sensor histidine kinase and response regulator CckA
MTSGEVSKSGGAGLRSHLSLTPDLVLEPFAQLASDLCATQGAAVEVLDGTTVVLRVVVGFATPGLPHGSMPLEASLCRLIVAAPEEAIVEDALADGRVRDAQLFRMLEARACAGAALRAPDGALLGSLFVLDRRARSFTLAERRALVGVARLVERELASLARQNLQPDEFRWLFDEHPQPMWVFDRETHAFLAVNAAAIALYGYAREEFLAMTIRDIRPEEDVPRLLENLKQPVEGLAQAGVWRHRRKNGDLMEVEITSHARYFEGRPAEIVQVVDVTERRAAERALLENESQLGRAQAVAHLGSWEIALPDRRLLWSAESYRIYGIDPATFGGTFEEFLRIVLEEDRPKLVRDFERLLEDGAPVRQDFRIVRADGEIRWIEGRGEKLVDASGVARVLGTAMDLTERKAAEQAREQALEQLSRKAQLLRMASRVAQLGAWWIDLGPPQVVHWSEEVFEILGLDPARGPDPEASSALIVPEHRARVKGVFDACCTRGVGYDIQAQFERHGERIWTRLIGEAVRDETGRIVRVQGAFQDISKQKAAEELLLLSQLRQNQLADAMPFIVWTTDAAGRIDYANHAYYDFTGVPSDTSLAEDWPARVHPEDTAATLATWQRSLERERPFQAELRLRGKQGFFRWFRVQGQPIREPTGRIVGWYGAALDVHETRETAEQLREQATLLDHAEDAIFVVGLNRRVTYWNRGAERLLGWSRPEAEGRTLDVLLRLEAVQVEARIDATLEAEAWAGELEVMTRLGQRRIVASRWNLLRTAAGAPNGLLIINTDITRQRAVEAQLFRAQRLESIGTLAGGIAHDLNNVLTPILAGVAMLREDASDAGSLEDLDLIEACARRGADMVRQLLAFARGRVETDRRRVSLSEVVNDVLRILRETFPKNIVAALRVECEPWPVVADPTQIHQLLMNLCVNARDAMATQGGVLTITLANERLDDVYAGMNPEAREGPYALIEVEDTGHGMPSAVLQRIFEPFFTTKDVGAGTGLGLSTCHAIAKNHGGFVHVYSEVGKGSRFKVYLPADSQSPAVDPTVLAEPALPRGSGECILVVDDEESIRKVTSRTLERFGYSAITAENGAQAVSIYARNLGRIALVLTDMSMPIMDGPAAIVALRSIDPDVVIVGSSGLDANGRVAKAVGAGVTHFIPKPYTAETLLQTIRRALSEGSSST